MKEFSDEVEEEINIYEFNGNTAETTIANISYIIRKYKEKVKGIKLKGFYNE